MTASPVHVRTLDEFLRRPGVSWLVDELLPLGEVGVLFGPSRSYKSFVALELAGCVSAGRPFAGRAVKKGKVIYLVAEGVAGMRDRAEILAKEGRLDGENIYIVDQGLQIGDERSRQGLADTLRAQRIAPSFVIVDTFARHAIGVKESDNAEMGSWLAEAEVLVREFGCTVLLVHHCGKDESKGMRGATALFGGVSTVIKSSRSNSTVTVSCEKQKDADEFAPVSFRTRRVQHGEIDSLVLDYIAVERRAGEPLKPDARALLDQLKAASPGPVLRTEFRRKDGSPIPDTSFDRAIKELIDRGYAERISHGEYLLAESPSPNYPQESPVGISSTPDKSPPAPPPYKGGDVGIRGGDQDGQKSAVRRASPEDRAMAGPPGLRVPKFDELTSLSLPATGRPQWPN